MELLGWDQKRYEYCLREDDFAWIKLGSMKPRCARLRYEEPSAQARRRAEEIQKLVTGTFGSLIDGADEPPFQFVQDLSSTHIPPMRDAQIRPSDGEVDLTSGWTL